MKKNRFSVMAFLAIVLAVSSAFVSKSEAESAAKRDITYYWFNTSNVYQMQNTQPSESARTGCNPGALNCEKGFTSSQLINPAQPSQGVKTGETPQVLLHRQ